MGVIKNIVLSEKQMEALKKLWFLYGNRGKKETLFNHKYIQGFIEAKEDRKDPYWEGRTELERKGRVSMSLTQECIDEVEKIVYNWNVTKFSDEYINFICCIGGARSRKDPANALFDMSELIDSKGHLLTRVAYAIKRNN